MIKKETVERIWCCYREIEAAEKLIADLDAAQNAPFADHEKFAPTLKDAFGRRRHLQMGIPSGESAHRIYDVHPELAQSVIRAHIAKKQAELAEANECARIELAAKP